MNLIEEIRETYESVCAKLEAYYETEAILEILKEEVVARHFDELRAARSNDARNQMIAALMRGNEEYERARASATEARMEFEAAKYRVEMVKLIASLQGGGDG